MPNRLKNLDVQWISLVRNPANGLPLLLKDANAKPFRVLKTDDERRMVYGIVYAPDQVDSQGDFADRFEIERAAHAFIKSGRSQQVDQNHQFEALPGAFVAESWIVRAADPEFADWVPNAWAVGIKIEDDALWQAIKSGEWAGLSLAGKAERETVGNGPASADASARAPAVSKADFDALCQTVQTLAKALTTPTPLLPSPVLDNTGDPPGDFGALQNQLAALVSTQTALAKRLETVEKQRLSAEHAPPPAPPKSWLHEVL